MKKIFLLLSILCTTLTLSAGPIGESRARQIAEEFFAQHTTRSADGAITLTWAGESIANPMSTGAELDNALMYIYKRGEDNGFVIVAGDNNVSPIIAYALNGEIDTNDMAFATRDILDAWCRQIEAARKEQIPVSTKRSATRSGDELLYQTALWAQNEPYNLEAPIYDGFRSVTGCAATAMAIICYYNRWPDKGVGTTPEYSYYDAYNQIRTVAANTLGRTYNYDNMLLDYSNDYTSAEGNAVAALMKDMGTSVNMSYHYTESGASVFSNVPAFTNYFKYSKEAVLLCLDNYDIDTWNEMMRENLRACGPTFYSGGSNVGGHAFVIDGYSYNDYFHINYGWGGSGNAWYLLPSIEFYARQAAIFDLVPDKSGTTQYRDNLQLMEANDGYNTYYGISTSATHYSVGESCSVYIGGIFNVGPRPFTGHISVVHCTNSGEWKEQLYTTYINDLPCESGLVDSDIITITQSIDEGDRLRLYFRSEGDDEWEWIRTFGGFASDEILLTATAKEVAKTLAFHYDKTQGVVFLESPNALQCELNYPNGDIETKEMQGHSYMYFIVNRNGEYTLNVRSGGEPYTLKFKL